MRATIPSTESERLNILRELHILDTSQEPYFEDLVETAASVLETPIAAISLVDENRQWFKASRGLSVTETCRDNAFCAHAILTTDLLVVSEALTDPRFADNPLVTGKPYIRSYLGAPLVHPSGAILGTLCAISSHPREWTPQQQTHISSLARQAMTFLTTRRIAIDAHSTATNLDRAQSRERRYESVVSAMAEGILILDRSGRFSMSNEAAQTILGYPQHILEAMSVHDSVWETIHPDGRVFETDEYPLLVSMKTGRAISDITMGVRHASGERRWLQINSKPIFEPGHAEPVQVVATFRDITDAFRLQQELVRSKRRLELALDVGGMAVLERERDSGTLIAHGPLAEILGETQDRADIVTVFSRIHADDRAALWESWKLHLQGGPSLRCECRLLHDSGDTPWVSIAAERVVDQCGAHTGALIVMIDITARKMAELAVQSALAIEAEANAAKSHFLANISHEIRTPLNGVMGVADILANTNLTANQKDLVELIKSSGDILNRVMSDILDSLKIESGQLQIEEAPFLLFETIRCVTELFRLPIEQKKLSFTVEFDRTAAGRFMGDAVRVKQVLANLLSNAMKFTHSGSIGVKLSYDVATGICIEVRDTGVGIPREKMSRLFKRFSQADASITRQFGGTGLGLSIVKSLVEAMGGSVECASAESEGSTFVVQIPLQWLDVDGSYEFQHPTQPQADIPYALIVEDNETNFRVFEAILDNFGWRTEHATNGAHALDAIARTTFDLVLMDIHMPVMDGLTAMRMLRAREVSDARAALPIIAVSANATVEDRRNALDAGATEFLAKPMYARALREALLKLGLLAYPLKNREVA